MQAAKEKFFNLLKIIYQEKLNFQDAQKNAMFPCAGILIQCGEEVQVEKGTHLKLLFLFRDQRHRASWHFSVLWNIHFHFLHKSNRNKPIHLSIGKSGFCTESLGPNNEGTYFWTHAFQFLIEQFLDVIAHFHNKLEKENMVEH